MEAGARGAVEAGGHTMGVTLSNLGRRGPNPYIRQEIPTFSLLVRLETLIRLGHAYVVLPGGTGTLLELAAVWEMSNKRILRRAAPLILLGEHWRPVVAAVRSEQPDAPEPFITDSVSAVLEVLSTHLAGTGNDDSAESAAD
jgi:predicted Rossmann-fold nucleotide-binding protein